MSMSMSGGANDHAGGGQDGQRGQDGHGASLAPFLQALASEAPTPGGGGAAASLAATGAALVSMVCRLTVGRKGCEAQSGQAADLLQRADGLRNRLLSMVDEDAVAFSALMAAYRLPRAQDEAGVAARRQTIQRALHGATQAPLECARAAADVVRMSAVAAAIGNPNVLSDAGVAALAGMAALRSAGLNVRINLPGLDDKVFAQAARDEMHALMVECESLARQVEERMDQALAG